jgi:GNAT superfamily N-acetyltransferase
MPAHGSHWKERLGLLRRRGGLKAGMFWVAKKLFGVDAHFIYAIALSNMTSRTVAPKHGNAFRTAFLHSATDVGTLKPDLIDRIEDQCGSGVARLVDSGSSVYALLDGEEIVSQLNICWNPLVRVDSPAHLEIFLKPTDGFLGYLFTHPGYRGIGAASKLVAMACTDAAGRGRRRLVTHIRATNSPSLNTFEKGGWRRIGWMLTSTSGRLLKVYVPSDAGLKFRPVLGGEK